MAQRKAPSRSATPEAVVCEYIDPLVRWELPQPPGQPSTRPFDRWYNAWWNRGYHQTHQVSDRPEPSLFRDALAVEASHEADVRRAASTITPADAMGYGEALVSDLAGVLSRVGVDYQHHLREGLAADLASTAAHALHSGRAAREERDKAEAGLGDSVAAVEQALAQHLDPALSTLAERLGTLGDAMLARKLRDHAASIHADLQTVRRDHGVPHQTTEEASE